MRLDRKIFVLGLFFFILMSISGIYSLSSEAIDSLENPLSIAYVDIKLTSEGIDSRVMPGDVIPINPIISNIGIDCYVRFRLTYTLDGKKANYEDIGININSDWVKKGDYFYYQKVLKRNEKVLLFDNISIPTTWGNEYSNSKLVISLVADAIQESHFEPKFDSMSPWGDTIVKKKVERNYSLDTEGYQTIIYENNSDRYLTVDSKFFNGLVNLTPGDIKKDYIEVFNTDDKPIKLYFGLEVENMTNDDKKLLETIKITVVDDSNNSLYNGPLFNGKKNYLKTYKKNEKDKLTFIISVPSEYDNEYGGMLSKIIWNLSCEEEKEQVDPSPKTGDEQYDISIKLFIISFIGLTTCLIIGKVNNKDKKI